MNKLVPIGLGAAAVVVAVVIGAQLLPSAPGGVGAPVASPSAEPTATPEAGGLPEGQFVLSSTSSPLADGLASTVTIAAPGWFGEPLGGIVTGDDVNAPSGAGLIGPFGGPLFIYGDPCRWSTTTPETPAATVDEVVAALTAQALRDATAPVDVTLDGYTGKSVTLHVPEDAVFSACDSGFFGTWAVPGDATPSRYHQSPGQIDEIWIVDVDGRVVLIDAGYYDGTPAEDVAEMRAIVESIDFKD
jgi:hypothetical protein